MGLSALKQTHDPQTEGLYHKILAIDGSHPLKDRVPLSYVEYEARQLKGGRVVYFNFPLAQDMGLLSRDHDDRMGPMLEKALLDTFALRIINEYDIVSEESFRARDIKPNRYMATRYLQMQHPNQKGVTSGDGRSIWNGTAQHNGSTWDITSCGTGATCLSPATAIHKRFYRSGDPSISYGCGLADLSEGMTDVVMSEVMTRNGIATERVLCVIEFPGKTAITVRAGLNLLRPSHFFNHLKQGQFTRLKNMADFFIDRQIANGTWESVPATVNRYDYMLQKITMTFSQLAAQFEAEYVFCWLDWDGDNILIDGGIIDFGSVRQFGLYHHEYRFDDDKRWSTNIKEQRLKARDIVQTFAQIADYLSTQNKRAHSRFKNSPAVKMFNKEFIAHKRRLLLRRIGFSKDQGELLIRSSGRIISSFEKLFYQFESAKSKNGPVKVADGMSWPAIYSMRDLLRDLPVHYLGSQTPVAAGVFMKIMKSSYAEPGLKDLNSAMKHKISRFQELYLTLLGRASAATNMSLEQMILQIIQRSAQVNCYHRMTGDAVCGVAAKLSGASNRLSPNELIRVIETIVSQQQHNPERTPLRIANQSLAKARSSKRLLAAVSDLVGVYREGI